MSAKMFGESGSRIIGRSGRIALPRATVANAAAMTSMHSSIGRSRVTSFLSRTTRPERPCSAITISIGCPDGAARANFGAHTLRLARPCVHGTPQCSRTGQESSIAFAANFGETLEAQSVGDTNPGAHVDLVTEHGRTLIVDLVPERHPGQLFAGALGSKHIPMRRSGVLHPAQVDHVIDVRPLIEIG